MTARWHSGALKVDMSAPTPTLWEDEVGNALGGIRTPAVDAPLAVLSGTGPEDAGIRCQLFGSTTPLTPSQLSDLYPTRSDFMRQWKQATRSADRNGYRLPEDAMSLREIVGG
jgi:hypothetical protein